MSKLYSPLFPLLATTLVANLPTKKMNPTGNLVVVSYVLLH